MESGSLSHHRSMCIRGISTCLMLILHFKVTLTTRQQASPQLANKLLRIQTWDAIYSALFSEAGEQPEEGLLTRPLRSRPPRRPWRGFLSPPSRSTSASSRPRPPLSGWPPRPRARAAMSAGRPTTSSQPRTGRTVSALTCLQAFVQFLDLEQN